MSQYYFFLAITFYDFILKILFINVLKNFKLKKYTAFRKFLSQGVRNRLNVLKLIKHFYVI